jgi:hypothetical protein
VPKPAAHLSLLLAVEFGRRARMSNGLQGLGAAGAKRSEPAIDRANMDAEKVGNVGRSVSIEDALDRESTATFQFRGW